MENVRVAVKKLRDGAQLPRYAHTGTFGDLAADLFAAESCEVPAGGVRAVSTGICMELPEGYGAIIEDRSGLALSGVSTLAGVVDSGYRGEVKVILVNLRETAFSVRDGDRIAQLRLVRKIEAAFEEVNVLGDTPRSDSGFGSTGTR